MLQTSNVESAIWAFGWGNWRTDAQLTIRKVSFAVIVIGKAFPVVIPKFRVAGMKNLRQAEQVDFLLRVGM